MPRQKGTLYDANPGKFLKIAKKEAEAGRWRYQIAQALGISNETFNDYTKAYPEFLEAVEAGETAYIKRIEKALDKSAEGHQITKTKTVERYLPIRKKGKIVDNVKVVSRIETVVEDVPPNPKSMELVLTNKTRLYRNRIGVDLTGFLTTAEADVTDEEVKALASALGIKLDDPKTTPSS